MRKSEIIASSFQWAVILPIHFFFLIAWWVCPSFQWKTLLPSSNSWTTYLALSVGSKTLRNNITPVFFQSPLHAVLLLLFNTRDLVRHWKHFYDIFFLYFKSCHDTCLLHVSCGCFIQTLFASYLLTTLTPCSTHTHGDSLNLVTVWYYHKSKILNFNSSLPVNKLFCHPDFSYYNIQYTHSMKFYKLSLHRSPYFLRVSEGFCYFTFLDCLRPWFIITWSTFFPSLSNFYPPPFYCSHLTKNK